MASQINGPTAEPAPEREPWTPHLPDAARPWDLDGAAHLLRRAGFGPTWKELQHALAAGPEETVRHLLARPPDADRFERDLDALELPGGHAAPEDQLGVWWLRRILGTPHPLAERLTLLWHGLFSTRIERVGNPAIAVDHLRKIRANALGPLDDLFFAAIFHPAFFLSTNPSRTARTRPHPNLARHLLEHCTVGPDAFSRQDLDAIMRLFDGWTIARGELHETPTTDPRAISLLGRSGRWTPRDAIRLLLDHPATSRRIAARLYREFVSCEPPGAATLDALAARIRKDRSISDTVGCILRSRIFHSAQTRRRSIRTPIEFAAAILRPLEQPNVGANLTRALAGLGQDLYHPPRGGWHGGLAWINSATLVGRARVARAILAGTEGVSSLPDPLTLATRSGAATPDAARRFLVQLLLQDALPQIPPAPEHSADGLRRFTCDLVIRPEFQLC